MAHINNDSYLFQVIPGRSKMLQAPHALQASGSPWASAPGVRESPPRHPGAWCCRPSGPTCDPPGDRSTSCGQNTMGPGRNSGSWMGSHGIQWEFNRDTFGVLGVWLSSHFDAWMNTKGWLKGSQFSLHCHHRESASVYGGSMAHRSLIMPNVGEGRPQIHL